MAEDGDYEVGYGKPPKKNQFKPGRSGNPRGRPKGAKNFATDILKELNEMITIRENGKTKRVTKRQLNVKALVAKGAKGDVKANLALIAIEQAMLADGKNSDLPLSADEREVLKTVERQIVARHLARKGVAEDE